MAYRVLLVLILAIISVSTEEETTTTMTKAERLSLREEARRMFYHAYNAYMDNAYPADELMPLSCKGRWKGITPSRGDMDDALGNFSLTLVDSLDTLAVMGDFSEFSRAMKLVIEDVSFDQDIVVSVFETNIRMLGGLLSAHVLALTLQPEVPVLQWYGGELLALAEDLGRRLLPAFNTSTGIPHGKINLRHGIRNLQESRETCTACAGTMILEMAALSRLTGKPVYEQKAHKAMDRLWKIRHRTSDLMGTVINIHSGDWVRKDSGVGAGIDSYYEYCLKAYILLGDEKYLARFNRHYNAVMKYISRGPVMLAVHMHRPHLQSRNFMDALLAFWPGLQVLLGDVRPAVETHEMLYQVMQRHTFLPEAFTTDFQVHWGQHPLRPEFLESTYFLHRATEDDHYLHVGKTVLKALQQYTKVPCGYAAVNDVRTRVHEDRMDSFVLAETFKYLYMLFGDDKDLPVKLEDYVLTTEAHFLPLSLAHAGRDTSYFTLKLEDEDEDKYRKTCPNTASLVAEKVRQPMRQLLGASAARPAARLRPLNDPRQLNALADMGISVLTLPDGRVQLLYTTNTAKSSKDAAEGLTFMREMSKWNSLSDSENGVVPAGVALQGRVLPAGPGHFGREVRSPVTGSPASADPRDACTPLTTPLTDKFAVAFRGHCTFAQKVRNLQNAGAKLAIIVDNVPDSTHETTAMFAMSGDGKDDIEIPAVFLFSREGAALTEAMKTDPDLTVTVGELKALKRQIENVCDEGECDSGIDTAATPDPESFDHLKKVLSQLVAQFELSLTHEEGTGERCGRASPLEGPSYINEANKLLPAAPVIESGPAIRTAPLTVSGHVIGTASASCPGSGTESESGPAIRTAPLTVSGHVIGTASESCPGSGTESESGPAIRTAPLTVSGHVIGTASESCPGSGTESESGSAIRTAPLTVSGHVIGTASKSCPGSGTETESGPAIRTVPLTASGHIIGTAPKSCPGPRTETETGPAIRTAPLTVSRHVIGTAPESCPGSGTDVAPETESGPEISTKSGPGHRTITAPKSESDPVISTESGPGHRTVTAPKSESGSVISTESGPGPNSGTAPKSESGPVINTESGPGPGVALESESGPVINTESGPGHVPEHVTKPDHL